MLRRGGGCSFTAWLLTMTVMPNQTQHYPKHTQTSCSHMRLWLPWTHLFSRWVLIVSRVSRLLRGHLIYQRHRRLLLLLLLGQWLLLLLLVVPALWLAAVPSWRRPIGHRLLQRLLLAVAAVAVCCWDSIGTGRVNIISTWRTIRRSTAAIAAAASSSSTAAIAVATAVVAAGSRCIAAAAIATACAVSTAAAVGWRAAVGRAAAAIATAARCCCAAAAAGCGVAAIVQGQVVQG